MNAAYSLRDNATNILTTYEKASVYNKMNGKTSTYKISEITKVPQRTVATWAEDFVKAGLATGPNETFTSHRALFTLTELSVDISTLRKRDKLRKDDKGGI
jgi:hypothetical protein